MFLCDRLQKENVNRLLHLEGYIITAFITSWGSLKVTHWSSQHPLFIFWPARGALFCCFAWWRDGAKQDVSIQNSFDFSSKQTRCSHHRKMMNTIYKAHKQVVARLWMMMMFEPKLFWLSDLFSFYLQQCIFVIASILFFPLFLYKKMKYTFISVPALGDKQNTFLNIKAKLTEYAQTYQFNIPEFKVSLTRWRIHGEKTKRVK